ncbi:MAG: Na+/H+ antiporter NhaC family protein [Eubacterium sp.]|nr:Na+/H+ antiporter NhaC family protein [Eubacterium sp.]
MKKLIPISVWAFYFCMVFPKIALAAPGEDLPTPNLFGTFWALVPPLVAIVLALITKEVYSSLVIGIIVGGVLASNGIFEVGMRNVLENGIVPVLSDSYNVGILIFLVILGSIVAMMNKSGGAAAFGRWAFKHIKRRQGAECLSVVLGMLIFIDDYFNCLTVGSVMRPITDKFHVSRAKLAYIIDATAAPVCIIAPISSWAAAVTSNVPEDQNGFLIFLQAIPYNYYALLTIVMLFFIIFSRMDYGKMKLHENNAAHGDLFTEGERVVPEGAEEEKDNGKAIVMDMLLPVFVLIGLCIIGMIYTGGFFGGTGIIDAFANCDASLGLVVGSFFAILFAIIYYMARRSMKFTECMGCLVDGFKAMVPAILILTFAWSLKGVTTALGAREFVGGLMSNAPSSLAIFIPVIVFLVGVGLAFSTGTSWGTFGILIPIVVAIFPDDPKMMVIAISACMAGSVCGDHCSPISDTTIMASAGAQCNHINHVNTQLPYALTVAAVSAVTYIIAGFVKNPIICLIIGVALMIGVLMVIKKKVGVDDEVELDR